MQHSSLLQLGLPHNATTHVTAFLFDMWGGGNGEGDILHDTYSQATHTTPTSLLLIFLSLHALCYITNATLRNDTVRDVHTAGCGRCDTAVSKMGVTNANRLASHL